MSEEKEYIVTLHNHSDCEQFYDEMESNKCTEFVSEKKFNCVHRREISRNTHYFMTDEEAIQLGRDRRVLGIEEPPENRGIYPTPCFEWDSTTHFVKPAPTAPYYNPPIGPMSNSQVQWGILRCASGDKNTYAEYPTDIPMPFDKLDTGNQEGENVDVVISDQVPMVLHPEFAVNRDGTGGSRMISHIWYSGYSPTSNYYSSESHGSHVAGIAAGNRQGWATKANIYHIFYDATNIDYIRTWHNNKTNGNPTVVNMSWSYTALHDYPIDTVNYRGTTYTNVSRYTALSLGAGTTRYNSWSESPQLISFDADLQDAMNDGIILVAAGDNYNMRYTRDPSDPDYNNYITDQSLVWGGPYYYHRGGSPTQTTGVISVGNGGFYDYTGQQAQDIKNESSAKGPRIDIFAPGTLIMSATNDSTYAGLYGILDNRSHSVPSSLGNPSQMYLWGTSMAAPQVTGAVACLVGIYRDFTQDDVRNWLIGQGSTSGDLLNPTAAGSNNYSSDYNLMGAPNRYLYFNRERKGTGQVWPDADRRIKDVQSTSTRQVYPRMKRNYNVP